MSSNHHVQSHSDPNYLIRLHNLQISEDAVAAGSSLQRTHSLNSSNYGAPLSRPQYVDGSKFVGAPRVAYVKREDLQGVHGNGCHTLPMSGHPQHAGLVRGIVGMHPVSVYENLDSVRPSYAQSATQYSVGPGTYEIIGKKNEPKPVHGSGMRHFAHTPDIAEPTPIYENLAQRGDASIPPPLLPKKSAQLHSNADTSGMYVQPQTILSQIQRSSSNTSTLPSRPAAQTVPRTNKVLFAPNQWKVQSRIFFVLPRSRCSRCRTTHT